ncbi:hypothetical protein JAAARDRAFT_588666 [Jaapia argillacea MUCL 33604]|uniref:BHLH domain-containing protein n=1 Tax=Jaapia argillacea MUCL 33604 TaxID=933084 RepID=A0A067PID2_9AGAM|nr:hypothetical protein JAAARDRAFT_588666 [Jaapia argillacea MUCL 33604]
MAISLPLGISSPSSLSSNSPPSSTGSPNMSLPTPVSPSNPMQNLTAPGSNGDSKDGVLSNPMNNNPNGLSSAANQPIKRKPSRRANTAERRATHNAVERARRETLNGRFLDLAALLPNLSQIRRPSKSAIVNSSIAHIHASRRHRLLAARELRLIKLESDALRRELNEWRDRAGLPRVEEPMRGEGFALVMSGECEVIPNAGLDDEEGMEDGDDEFVGVQQHVVATGPATGGGYGGMSGGMGSIAEELMMEEMRNPMMAAAMLKNASGNPYGHTVPNPSMGHQQLLQQQQQQQQLASILPRPIPSNHPGLMGSRGSPNGLVGPSPFDNSGGLVSPGSYLAPQQQQQPQSFANFSDMDKVAAWNAQLYGAISGTPPSGMFTPPASAHSSSGGSQRQAMYVGSPVDGDDGISVGSVQSRNGGNGGSGRERSASFGSGSGYGSPGSVGSNGGFEMSGLGAVAAGNGNGGNAGDYGLGGSVPRRMTSGWAGSDLGGNMGGLAAAMGLGGMKAMAVGAGGGGGNGGGFAMMM